MPQDSNVHVLRHHGFDELADWAENPVLAPDYARQSQYWASVLLAPVYRDFAEWEPRDAREFQFDAEDEAELPEADLPFLFPLIGVAAAVLSSIQRRITRRRCHGKRGHMRNCGRTITPRGVIQGSILC